MRADCILWVPVALLALGPLGLCGDFEYRLESLRQVGGPTGTSVFVDEFDDGAEPPSGPSGPATYFVPCPMDVDAEAGGSLGLSFASLCIDGDETFIDGVLADGSFDIQTGVGGLVEVRYTLPGGVVPLADFGIELFSFSNGMSVSIHKTASGAIVAQVEGEGSGAGVIESETDISSHMLGVSDLTLRLDALSGTRAVARLDFGSDGSFDLTLPGLVPLLPGTSYRGGYIAGLEGEWSDEGCALPGVSGAPLLVGDGPLVAGSSNSASLSAAAPGALSALFLALSSTPIPFKGGTLKPHPFFVPFVTTTGSFGNIFIPFLMPAGISAGTELWVQWAIQDSAAVNGVALSNAIKGVTP